MSQSGVEGDASLEDKNAREMITEKKNVTAETMGTTRHPKNETVWNNYEAKKTAFP
jgi:hypothetical protein